LSGKREGEGREFGFWISDFGLKGETVRMGSELNAPQLNMEDLTGQGIGNS